MTHDTFMEPQDGIDRPEPGPGVAWQVFGFLGGTAAYAIHLFIGLAFVPLSCDVGTTWPIHAATIVSVLAIAGSTATAWWVRRSARRSAPVIQRRRWLLGTSGLFLNGLAVMAVVFSDVPSQVLNPCI
jgi:hypothetical protein